MVNDAMIKDALSIFLLPKTIVDLMCRQTEHNDSFYQQLVHDFFRSARRRHQRFPLVGQMTHGVALCDLAGRDFFDLIEASGRRNVKKARRLGYVTTPIEFNTNRAAIMVILRSAPERQGEMPTHILEQTLPECKDPPSHHRAHAYEYYGVSKDKRLVAFAGVFVAGEAVMIEQIYGHADFLADGVVPMLLVDMQKQCFEKHPDARFYIYGTFFGGGESFRRFKKKFGFLPHRVKWQLG